MSLRAFAIEEGKDAEICRLREAVKHWKAAHSQLEAEFIRLDAERVSLREDAICWRQGFWSEYGCLE